MMAMIRVFITAFLLVPVFVFAYTSVIIDPESAFVVVPILQPELAQEFFGELKGFPHTYEFVVTKQFDMNAQVSVHNTEGQENNISIILVKEEKRGVSEVDRTHNKEYVWDSERNNILAESFRTGGSIVAQLETGIYRLEVSSPDNNGTYHLVLGTDDISYGYLENINRVFEVKSLLGKSKFSAVSSPLLYWPIGIFLFGVASIYLYRKKRRPHA